MPNAKELEYFRNMEGSARRGASEAKHPGQCPKLRFHGVDFAIPPRGLRVVPKFGSDGQVTLDVDGVDEWPEVQAIINRAGPAGPMLDVTDPDSGFIDVLKLVRKLLLKQYKLSDEQISELMAFENGGSPEWLSAAFRWCMGMSDGIPASFLADQLPEPEEPPVIPKRRWWQRHG